MAAESTLKEGITYKVIFWKLVFAPPPSPPTVVYEAWFQVKKKTLKNINILFNRGHFFQAEIFLALIKIFFFN